MCWRAIVMLLFLTMPWGHVSAQIGPPNGWKADLFEGGVALTSPPDAAGRTVTYMQMTSEQSSAAVRSWFTQKTVDLRKRVKGPAPPSEGVRMEEWTAPDGRLLTLL